MDEASIYILPTKPLTPPTAIIGPIIKVGPIEVGVQVLWSSDLGTWVSNGTPVDAELAEAITEHAKALGVPGF